MTPPGEPRSHSARISQCVVAAVIARPIVVLAAAAVLIGLSVYAAAEHLRYKPQRGDLISADKDCQRRWRAYTDIFGPDDDFVFVIRGADRARLVAAARELGVRLQSQNQFFDRVFHEVDLRALSSRSLQYLSLQELQSIESRLDDAAPLFQSNAVNDWSALLTAAGIEGMKSHGSPASGLTQPQALLTPDGRLALVLARPRLDSESFTPARDACRTARAMLDEMRRAHTGLEFGLTGLPVLETDEMAGSDEDSTRANWLALGGVLVLYLVVYRGLRYPLLTMTTLVVGTVLTLGWAAITVGHLNILSAAFAVMLIGLGDYGVLWIAHYDEARRRGDRVRDALLNAAAHAGPGIITAAVTAAFAFAATMLADFRAVAELGWIAGCGVLFCAFCCFTVLPALIVLSERLRRTRPVMALPFPGTGRSFLPALAARPRRVLAVGFVLSVMLSIGLTQIRYDANLLHMQARGLDSVYWEEELIRHAAGTTWDSLSLAATRDEALALKAKYEATPGVGYVMEAASLLPADYAVKMPVLESIQRKLAGLPASLKEKLPPFLVHCDTRPITIAELPVAFRERYVAADGTFLVRAFASESLWDFAALVRFTQSAQSVDPNATGKSFRTVEGLRQMRGGFLKAGAAALLVIVVVLWLDFRKPRIVLLGLLPLGIGLAVTLGVMGWCGVSLNPANLIALPLIIGVGLDNGVHVLHDYLESPGRRRYRLAAVTGRGICVAALTTILGFGTLMIARHRGLASLGLALTLGVAACMAAALIILPAILALLPRTAKPTSQATTDRLAA